MIAYEPENINLQSGGARSRTLINGFGDRRSTIELHPHNNHLNNPYAIT